MDELIESKLPSVSLTCHSRVCMAGSIELPICGKENRCEGSSAVMLLNLFNFSMKNQLHFFLWNLKFSFKLLKFKEKKLKIIFKLFVHKNNITSVQYPKHNQFYEEKS